MSFNHLDDPTVELNPRQNIIFLNYKHLIIYKKLVVVEFHIIQHLHILKILIVIYMEDILASKYMDKLKIFCFVKLK